MKNLKVFLIAGLLTTISAVASTQEMVSVRLNIRSHHGSNERLSLDFIKGETSFKLIADGIVLPETSILTNRKDLEVILNFTKPNTKPDCERNTYIYKKTAKGKSTEFSGCMNSKGFRQLRNSFQNISAIK